MDWLKKNYERALLIVGIAALLVSAFCIFRRATGFQSQFAELQSHPTRRPPSPPPHATARSPARQSERGRRCFAEIATAAAMDLRRAFRALCSRKTIHRHGRP